MKQLLLFLIGGAMTLYSIAGETPALTLHKTAKVCTPDGVANTDGTEPWIATWIDMTAKKTANKSDEISAKFQLAYNDTYLWVVCQQTGNSTMDTDPATITQSWQRDDFEIFVSMDTTAWAHGGAYGEYNNQFRMQRAAEYPWGFDDAHSIFKNHPECTVGQVDAGDGSFVQEWQMSWVGLTTPMADSGTFDGNYIRFEIQAADNTTGSDGGRSDQIFWRNNSDNEYQDSRTLSLISIGYVIPCRKSARIDADGVLLQPNCEPPGPGIKSNSLTDDAIIFPNPATEYLKISNDGTFRSVCIKNILGEEIIRIAVKNEKTISIPLTNFGSGLYIVIIKDKTGMSGEFKFVKK